MKNAFLLLLLAACGTAPAEQAATTAAAADTTVALATATTTAATSMSPAAAPTPRYDIRGIFDPGFDGMVAFALKIPHGWTLQQSFGRRWIDHYPIEEIFNSIASPDGKTVFVGLPQLSYSYVDDPQMQQIMRLGEQQSEQHDKSFVAPLLPVAYLKTVLLPLLAQQAHVKARVVAEHQDPVQTDPQTHGQLATGYVDAVLDDGSKLRLQTQLLVFSSPMTTPQAGRMATSYNWTADNLLIQTAGDLATAVAQQAAVQKSIAVNPAWAQKNAALKQRGSEANNQLRQQQTQQMLQQAQQRLAQQRQQFAQHNAAWAAQQHANDQSSAAFRDYLGGQTLYQNAETGQRTRVESGYNHVYQDGQGNTLSTNAPLDGNHVNWQELQQVELKNY